MFSLLSRAFFAVLPVCFLLLLLCSGVHCVENTNINTSHMIKLHAGPPQDYDYVNLPFLLTLRTVLYTFYSHC